MTDEITNSESKALAVYRQVRDAIDAVNVEGIACAYPILIEADEVQFPWEHLRALDFTHRSNPDV